MADTIIEIKLQPRASKNELQGFHGNELWVRTTAAPVDSEANSALLKMLSEVLDIPKTNITIITGLRNRHKVVKIRGIEREEAIKRLTSPTEEK